MVGLQHFFSSVGIGSSRISILDVGRQFDMGSPFSIINLVQVASGSPDPTNKDFRVLPIEIQGSGNYRADRFRIYFRHPNRLFPLPVPNLVSELGRLFPQIFNGFGSEVDGFGLTQNVATTFYRFDKPFNDEPTLQFTLDIRTFFDLNAPDLHDDWVGFVHQNSNGFTVQTLKRNFTQENDVLFGLAIAQIMGVATLGMGGILPLGFGITTSYLNRFHFLSGRRSWVIAQANQVRGSNFIATNPIPDFLLPASQERLAENQHVYVLETAAIDRFSSWIVEVAEFVPGVNLNNIDQIVANIWTILLNNFVKFMGFIPVDPLPGLYPALSGNLREVRFIQASFNSRNECLAQGWVQDMLALHPGIAEQF